MNTNSPGRKAIENDAGKGAAMFAAKVLAGTPPKGRVSKNLPKAVVFEILTAYKEGQLLKVIAAKYGISKQCVSNIASRRGLRPRSAGRPKKEHRK